MATTLQAAELMVLRAASLRDIGQPCLKEASMAKLFASETAEQVCNNAIQILGGYGYLNDFPVERIYRDVRVCKIYEGTSEIQRLVISRQLALEERVQRSRSHEMIARMWRATATAAKAPEYSRHFMNSVAPHLKDIAGHHGAFLLQHKTDQKVEFIAITLWDSIETIKRFTGPNPEVAIVEPEGRAALIQFDQVATNYDVLYGPID